MSDWYILDDDNNVVAADIRVASDWLEKHRNTKKRIGKDELWIGEYGVLVSTVFLGLDHSFGGGPPLVFETMVFADGDWGDLHMERYSTYDEAVLGHARIVKTIEDNRDFIKERISEKEKAELDWTRK